MALAELNAIQTTSIEPTASAAEIRPEFTVAAEIGGSACGVILSIEEVLSNPAISHLFAVKGGE